MKKKPAPDGILSLTAEQLEQALSERIHKFQEVFDSLYHDYMTEDFDLPKNKIKRNLAQFGNRYKLKSGKPHSETPQAKSKKSNRIRANTGHDHHK